MFQEKFIIKSYAKINLHLEVLNKRKDNYHNLFSLMGELELADLLKLESFNITGKQEPVIVDIINSGGLCSSITDKIPAEKNLITIAVKNYLEFTGHSGHFRFTIEKNIPSGAGLGGGSSNAASALKLTARAIGRNIDDDMKHAAFMTGSDVPFFLTGGFAFVEGRGELIFPFDLIDESYVLLVNNGIHIDTGIAYRSLRRPFSEEPEDYVNRKNYIEKNVKNRQLWKDIFRNDFEKIIFTMHPEIGSIKEKMYDYKSFFALMTGSGSTVFGLFKNRESALLAQSYLQKDGHIVYFTKFRSGIN